jgi:hypothetical protein
VGEGGDGGIKVYPPSKIFTKLVNKNGIKHQKGVPSPKNFHNPYIPPSQKVAKSSWTLPLDFQTVCIYGIGYVKW